MNKIYLKTGAEDIHGSKLNTRIEYILIYKGLSHSVITYGYGKKIYINNKYIKSEPRSNWSRLFYVIKCYFTSYSLNAVTKHFNINHREDKKTWKE